MSTSLRTDEVLSLEAKEILRRRKQQHPSDFNEHGRALYRELNDCRFAALCLSGGGIRSAAFGLGVLQALAVHPVSAGGREWDAIPEPELEQRAKNSFLAQFDYLSTVSGGGYIGSWLSAWCTRAGFQRVWQNLVARPGGPDLEPGQIGWLRSYSNYLTPKLGLTSADAWSAIAIYIGNLLLNWLIILPLFCCAIIVLKILAVLLDAVEHTKITAFSGAHWFENQLCPIEWQSYTFILGIPGILLLIAGLAFVVHHRIARLPTEGLATQTSFLWFAVLPLLVSAVLLAQFLGSDPMGRLVEKLDSGCEPVAKIQGLPVVSLKDGPATAAGMKVGDIVEKFRGEKVTKIWDLRRLVKYRPQEAEVVEVQFKRDHEPESRTRLMKLPRGMEWDDLGIEIGSTGGLRLKEPLWKIAAVGGIVGTSIYLLSYFAGFIFGWKTAGARGFFAWLISGFAFGAVAAFAYCFLATTPGAEEGGAAEMIRFYDSAALPLTIAVPWLLCSLLVSFFIFVGLASYRPQSDADREWLGRAAGWLLSVALLWFAMAFLTFGTVLLLPYAQSAIASLKVPVITVSGISGLITAILSKRDLAIRQQTTARDVRLTKLANLSLSVAAPLFVAGLVVILSNLLDKLLLGKFLFEDLQISHDWQSVLWRVLIPLAVGLGAFIFIGGAASYFININKFSLHALYRNRLVRAFLGATRARKPDLFTGFDDADNPKMCTLWPEKTGSVWQPFHVINLTLNLVSAKKLSWQERKAAPFTVSPAHCGTGSTVARTIRAGESIEQPRGAYRATSEYGDGITLGTAMAISGAAVSPNMGYHSSPAITFLMSMLNVRLGWWLGNPAFERDRSYAKRSPALAILPLLQEALGLTTGDRRYVYLSDGGHFDNLGLYEMVRRRCRFILVVDAGCDPQMWFEDLGSALRKISIDLGVSIKFVGLEKIRKRDPESAASSSPCFYHAVGEIDYESADGAGGSAIIIYVKPAFYGAEGAAIRAYAAANADFPHQSTLDQWFSESQFESYRALGVEIMQAILQRATEACTQDDRSKLPNIFAVLHQQAAACAEAGFPA